MLFYWYIFRFPLPPVVSAILYLYTHLGILIFSFSPPFFVCFQLSNGFSHFSLSSESHAGPVGAGPSLHCLPASRLLPRVTSVHLPDYAHYYTIGPGMFPSSQIPSWKVCVSLPFPVPPSCPPFPSPLLPSLLPLIASVLTALLFCHPPLDSPLPSFFFHTLPSSPQPFFLRSPQGGWDNKNQLEVLPCGTES